ncbi:Shewanella-like protein phosphatase 1 [Citrus sinensis]|uniref:Shewanella-like protein phosphatase 1 n=1 Tax=Citrus sinensis TaxID=2711 RepID=A0ACB8J063_CITSI|nr:Shewanella-like protein phosphatase 1 [Citrus sinensis]
MASLCMNSLPLPPSSHSKKLALTEASSSSNGSIAAAATASKPIVVSGNTPTFVSAPGRRIVAVGDLHGDLDQARCALEMAGVLSSDGLDLWTGGESVLIQLGDVLDRGEDELAILSLLRSLDMQAKAEGGAVFQVNGNHETMNVEGDFRYVDSGGFDECSDFLEYLNDYENDWEEAFVGWVGMSERWKEDRRLSRNYWGPLNLVKRQKGVIARSVLFRPGGPMACELARHGVVLKINAVLQDTLRAVGAKAMVVGHTPQFAGANCEYNCSIWRIDVGMSSGVLNSRPEVLEITDNKARVISGKRDTFTEFHVVDYT